MPGLYVPLHWIGCFGVIGSLDKRCIPQMAYRYIIFNRLILIGRFYSFVVSNGSLSCHGTETTGGTFPSALHRDANLPSHTSSALACRLR